MKTDSGASASESNASDAQVLDEEPQTAPIASERREVHPYARCTNVPNDPIAAALLEATAYWCAIHDPDRLKAALLRILQAAHLDTVALPPLKRRKRKAAEE